MTRTKMGLRAVTLATALLAAPDAGVAQERYGAEEFQVGDRILLRVEGEEALSDTLSVGPGLVLAVPGFGALPLAGVPRSRLEAHIAAYIGRFIKDPVVHATPLLRLVVGGDVGRPGIYAVPPDAMLADVLMRAGGPTQTAELTEIRVERGDEPILEGDAVREAITRGYTLARLGLRPGDRIIVPRESGLDTTDLLQIVLTLPTVIFAVSQLF